MVKCRIMRLVPSVVSDSPTGSFGDVPDGGLFTLAVDFVAVERVLGFVDLLDNGAKSRPVRVNDGVGVFGVVCNLGCGVRLGVARISC